MGSTGGVRAGCFGLWIGLSFCLVSSAALSPLLSSREVHTPATCSGVHRAFASPPLPRPPFAPPPTHQTRGAHGKFGRGAAMLRWAPPLLVLAS